jgi:hypothetical protein
LLNVVLRDPSLSRVYWKFLVFQPDKNENLVKKMSALSGGLQNQGFGFVFILIRIRIQHFRMITDPDPGFFVEESGLI